MKIFAECANGALRLVGGSTEYEGRVEMCKDGRFGTVCDAGFGNSDAKVVCKELGHRLRGKFGQGRITDGFRSLSEDFRSIERLSLYTI